uniref:Uncharacterized protein n=1 Tax=Anguilla anguilla TaxID=7936 RepID=A0A0E9WWG1_ANGAN
MFAAFVFCSRVTPLCFPGQRVRLGSQGLIFISLDTQPHFCLPPAIGLFPKLVHQPPAIHPLQDLSLIVVPAHRHTGSGTCFL